LLPFKLTRFLYTITTKSDTRFSFFFFFCEGGENLHKPPNPGGLQRISRPYQVQVAPKSPEGRKTPCSPYCRVCRIRCQALPLGMAPDIAYRLKTHLFTCADTQTKDRGSPGTVNQILPYTSAEYRILHTRSAKNYATCYK